MRRGLAGEMLDLLPSAHYFTGLRALRWLPSTFFVFGLVTLAWVAVKRGGCERRLMLALLTPALPFGFAFAVFSASPHLFGGVVLTGFAVALASAKRDRSILFVSGFAIAVLALVHEAIPYLFSLGAVVAIVVLAAHSSRKIQRLGALLAVAPGLAVAIAAAVLGRRGLSSQLCASVPHGAVDWASMYLLYASGQPDAVRAATRRTRVVFAVGAILLALFPVGAIPGFGVPPPV